MGVFTFKGGVHPYDGKDLSKDKPILVAKPKGDLVYPLSQHIGAPAKPIVAVGDYVVTGQKIAEAGGFVSAPIYATVSGTVKVIEPRRVPVGDMILSIVVENDHEYKEAEYTEVDDVTVLSKEDVINKIKEAGIVGMGGAGFPTHVKLSPKEPEKIDYIIANCSECEPYLTSDYRVMLEDTEKLVGGLKIILSLFDNAQGIIAIEDNKPDCIEKLANLVKNESKIKVVSLQTKYPQGSERQLIYAVTKRTLNSSMLPADVGCIVDNTDTIVNIYNAVKLGKPLMQRVVTITGDAIANPRNFRVQIGTSFAELVEAAGGYLSQPAKVISGGPMMGFALFNTDVPVIKTTSALLAMTEDDVAKFAPTPCINCGRCVEVCPSRIVPAKLGLMANHGRMEEFEKLNGMECVECGSCSYVCPAKRPVAQSIKAMRKTILANRQKKK
ncbi:MAG: electron transport complex subunit RsxC [Lachnospiraceae bacterium]